MRATKQVMQDTAKDLRLEKYLELKERAKVIEKELEQLKSELIHIGSHSTENFAVIVECTKTVRAPTKETLLKEFGDKVSRLFIEGTRTDIRIARLRG